MKPHLFILHKFSLKLLSIVVGLTFVGCGNHALTLYPELSNQKKRIQKSTIVADYVVIDATMGDTNIVDIAGNKNMAVALMDQVSDLMNAKEYHVENRLLSSIGLLMDKNIPAKVMHSVEDQELDQEDLGLQAPPFYVYQVFQKDPVLKGLLSKFYTTLLNTTKQEGESNPIIPEAIPVGKRLGGGTLAVLLTGGFNIPAGKELGIINPSGSITLGKVGTHSISQVTVMLYIVDVETGELLWADLRHEIGGTIHKARVLKIAEKVIANLP